MEDNDRRGRALLKLLTAAGVPHGVLGPDEVRAAVGAWLHPKVARFFDPGDPRYRKLPLAEGDTVKKYVAAWRAYAQRHGWQVTASSTVGAWCRRALNRINGLLAAAYPESLRAAAAPKQPGLREVDVAAMTAAASTPGRRQIVDLVVLSRGLLLRPGEIVQFSEQWVDPACHSTPAGSTFYLVNVPRLKNVATNPFPRPSLLYGAAIEAGRRLSLAMRSAACGSIAGLLADPGPRLEARAMRAFTAGVRDLAAAAGVEARRANAYSMRHGGAEALIDRPPWVAEVQGGWCRGSQALANHYQIGQLEILSAALAEPVGQVGSAEGHPARATRRDLLRGGQDC